MSAFIFLFISVACMQFFHYGKASDASKCYHCEQICNNPMDIEDCPTNGHYSCMSAKRELYNQSIKGCVSDYDMSIINGCDTIDSKPHQINLFLNFLLCTLFLYQVDSSSVSYCYHCYYKCKDPIQIQTCPSGSDNRCLAAKDTKYNQELKGCISTSNFAVISECNSLNKEPDQSCHICDSDLCNSAASYHLPVILLLSLAALSKIF
ncbi:hypothetical protein MTP99_017427 [Tenebrio molitor]|nr:hypothetical protein MTP99_017427 [Tenebrio molitor]